MMADVTCRACEQFPDASKGIDSRSEPEYLLRPIVHEDCDWLYRISMDAETRANSTRTAHFTETEHGEWFHRRIGDPNTRTYVLEVDRERVGQCRFGLVKRDQVSP